MLKKKYKYLFIIIIICLLVITIFCKNILIVNTKCNSNIVSFGIIDGLLSELKYDNIIYPSINFSEEKTHGDQLVEFSNYKNFKGDIYYYPAVDNYGKITNKSIVSGLNWMLDNNVKFVNISLSSKKYDSELENWIKQHPNVKIYCSYNNQINTLDYPALYESTIASDTSKKINYKSIDKKYHTNKIFIYNKEWHFFEGNSFLSINTLLNS